MYFGGHDFFADGSAALCTMQGDVWHVEGLDNTLRNVPDPVIHGWLYPGPAPVNFETFYIDPSKAK